MALMMMMMMMMMRMTLMRNGDDNGECNISTLWDNEDDDDEDDEDADNDYDDDDCKINGKSIHFFVPFKLCYYKSHPPLSEAYIS